MSPQDARLDVGVGRGGARGAVLQEGGRRPPAAAVARHHRRGGAAPGGYAEVRYF